MNSVYDITPPAVVTNHFENTQVEREEHYNEEDGAQNDNDDDKNATTPLNYPDSDTNGATISREELILNMAAHVHSYKVQRSYANQKSEEAKNDFDNNVVWPQKRYCLTGDYSQNLGLSHFGGVQPGETYYYSSLSISIFGLANHENEVLDAYVYSEGEGRKGGNNVASLIYKKIKDAGIIEAAKLKGPGKELTIIFNNCADQNKNRMVLRFAQYLIDADIFKRVEIVFLIAGHTKNICDRRFKDLKMNFHPKNVYTFNQMIEVLGQGKIHEEKILLYAPATSNFFIRVEISILNFVLK